MFKLWDLTARTVLESVPLDYPETLFALLIVSLRLDMISICDTIFL
jgi:hypothetical protein